MADVFKTIQTGEYSVTIRIDPDDKMKSFHLSIPDPKANCDGGMSYRLRYSNLDSDKPFKLVTAGVIGSFENILSPHMTQKEAFRRLKIMRLAYAMEAENHNEQ